MDISRVLLTTKADGIEADFTVFIPNANTQDFIRIIKFFNDAELPEVVVADVVVNEGPDDLPDKTVEEDTVTISDTQLLNAVAAVAEKVGPDKAKELVKIFAVGRGRPTVKNVPADKRAEFIEALKEVMVLAATEAPDNGDDRNIDIPETTDTPAFNGSRRRRS